MKNTFTVLCLTLLISLISLIPSGISDENSINAKEISQTEITCQTSTYQANPSDAIKSYEGMINKKYKISMTLIVNSLIKTPMGTEVELRGTYMYKSQGIPIRITGSIDPAGNLTLNEFDENENMTGIFKGWVRATNISGLWMKPDGSKSMPFILTESASRDESTETRNEPKLSKAPLNWGGEYANSFRTTLRIDGTDLNTNATFQFELTESSSQCAEQVSGTAKLINRTTAVFKNDEMECGLNFTFKCRTN